MHARALFLLLAIAASAACDEGDAPYAGIGTLDAPYVASLEWTSTTCGETAAEKPKFGVIDVFLRSDGKTDLIPSMNIPIPVTYRGLAVGDDGNVAFEWIAMSLSGQPFPQRVTGTLTASGLDLTIDSTVPSYRSADGRCQRIIRLRGAPARLHDARAVDGFHQVATTFTQDWCPDGAGMTGKTTNRLMQVMAKDDKDAIVSFLGLTAVVPLSRSGGALDWQGAGLVEGFFGPEEIDVRIAGSTSPSATDLTFFVPDESDPSCGIRVHAAGARRPPSSTSADNAYRTAFRWTDPCDESGGPIEAPVSFITQADGTAWIDEGGEEPTVVQLASDGTFSLQSGSEAEGLVVTYAGRVQPPRLSYEMKARYQDFHTGAWCEFHATADGAARYLRPTTAAAKTSALRLEGMAPTAPLLDSGRGAPGKFRGRVWSPPPFYRALLER